MAATDATNYRITYTPRNNKGTVNLKVRITSVEYPDTTLDTAAFAVVVANDCPLTSLTNPSAHTITNLTYMISGSSTT